MSDERLERRDRRWHCALHEVGHLVIAKYLSGKDGMSMLFADGSALSWMGKAKGPVNVVSAGILAVAGERAALLAERWAAPEISELDAESVVPLDSIGLPVATDAEAAVGETALTDRENVECFFMSLDLPRSLRGLWLNMLQQMADHLLEQHEIEVVGLAQDLYRNGRVNGATEPPPAPAG